MSFDQIREVAEVAGAVTVSGSPKLSTKTPGEVSSRALSSTLA